METTRTVPGSEVVDTIAAIATAPGRAGIGIVRISGPRVVGICESICDRPIPSRTATLCHFRSAQGDVLDTGIAVFFPSPRSYTGEDVLELQGHGGSVIVQLVLERALECGARRARPGEFTERAFLNARIDLTQAEAVADLIDASSVRAARAAQRSLSGALSRRVEVMLDGLTELRMQLEAALDFADEDIPLMENEGLARRAARLLGLLDGCIEQATAGCKLNDAVNVVIAGAPNVGKSSLLNALLGTPRAIVTELPGTTRDVILEQVVIQGLQLQLCDTAGLRCSEDVIERAGIALTGQRIADADIIVRVLDGSQSEQADAREFADEMSQLPTQARRLEVINKIDLGGQAAGARDGVIYLSATTGDGMQSLRDALVQVAEQLSPDGDFTARQRHLDCLHAAREHARAARELIAQSAGMELVAEEFRLAQQGLDELTGRVTSDDILGRIFLSFCIGK